MVPNTFLEIPFFARLDRGIRERLVGLARSVELPAGATLIRRGDLTDELYVVREGALNVVDTRSRPETVVDVVGPGGVVGEMTFIDPAPREADFRARFPSVCLCWERAPLLQALSEDDAFAAALYQALAAEAVSRARTITTRAVAGGLGQAAETRESTPEKLDLNELVAPLRLAWEGARAGREGAREALRGAIEQLCAALAAVKEPDQAAATGAQLREDLRGMLEDALSTARLLNRVEGSMVSPKLLAHACSDRARGRSQAGIALDRVLLEMPTLRGIRVRTEAAIQVAGGLLPTDRPARVVAVHCSSGRLIEGILPAFAAQGAQIHCLEGSEAAVNWLEGRLGQPPEAVRVHLSQLDLARLGSGLTSTFIMNADLVLIDGISDLLPERLVIGLADWASVQLAPTGHLLLAHATPAWDAALFDHLLGWPLLRRTAAKTADLLRSGKIAPVGISHEGSREAPGAVLVGQRAARK